MPHGKQQPVCHITGMPRQVLRTWRLQEQLQQLTGAGAAPLCADVNIHSLFGVGSGQQAAEPIELIPVVKMGEKIKG